MLSNELNNKIMRLAGSFQPVDNAPDTFKRLKESSLGILKVYAGASDNTIYGDPSVNWAFRAWHDQLHLKLGADFTLEGEILVAREQARLIDSDAMGDIIIAEVQGQAEYFAAHGQFPVDQIEFIKKLLH